MKRLLIFLLFLIITTSQLYAQRTDLSGLKFCFDAGHGGYGSNDRHVIPDAGIDFWESVSNYYKAVHIKHLLEAKGAVVYLTRTALDSTYSNTNDPAEPSLTARWQFANANNVHWFHSIHSNAYSGTVNYTLLLVKEDIPTRTAVWPQAAVMSDIMGPKIQQKLRNTMRSVWTYLDYTFYGGPNGGYNLGVLSGTAMPAELSEGSFHDYYPETRRLMNNDYRKMEAYALRDAFLQYYGVPADTKCIIAGIQTDVETGKPMNTTRVRLMPENKIYNGDSYNNGFYMFDELNAGTKTVLFEKPGYEPDSITVNIIAGSTTFIDRNLKPRSVPTIYSTTPTNGDPAYPANQAISIWFTRSMNTALTQSAFSISPSVIGVFTWTVNNTVLTFKPDSLLKFNLKYTVKIDTSARSAQGMQFDGNGDGVPGDSYSFSFTTKYVDILPPQAVILHPAPNDTVATANQVFNFLFDEPINPATVTASAVAIQQIGATGLVPRTVVYAEAAGRGGVTVYLSSSLIHGKSYYVRIALLADLAGNSIQSSKPILYQFTVSPQQYTYSAIDTFTTLTVDWLQPKWNANSVGIDTLRTGITFSTQGVPPYSSGSGAMRLPYKWDTTKTNWLMEVALTGGPAKSVTFIKNASRLQTFVYGDGSGTQMRFVVEDSVDVFPGGTPTNKEVSKWISIQWIGWKLVEWDLEKEECGSWVGNGKLEGLLRFGGYQFTYQPNQRLSTGQLQLDAIQVATKVQTGIAENNESVPSKFVLLQNYPNPFNPRTAISYSLLANSSVELKVFDILGREVAILFEGVQNAGAYTINWDASSMPSGVYFYRLQAQQTNGGRMSRFVDTKRMLLLK